MKLKTTFAIMALLDSAYASTALSELKADGFDDNGNGNGNENGN